MHKVKLQLFLTTEKNLARESYNRRLSADFLTAKVKALESKTTFIDALIFY